MDKESKLLIVIGGVAIIALSCVFLWATNRKQSSPSAESLQSHTSLAAIVTSERLVEVPMLSEIKRQSGDATKHYSIDVRYPSVSLVQHPELAKEANAVILSFVNDGIDSFIEDIEEFGFVDETRSIESDYTMRYRALLVSPTIISLRFDHSQYIAGAAHPDSQTRILNYDLERHLLLSTTDLFASTTMVLPFLSTYTRNALAHLLLDKSEETLDQQALSGTLPTHENFGEVGITKEGLLVIFTPYQVAPYARGAIEVPVFLTDLSDTLSPPVEKAIHLAETNIVEASPEAGETGE